MKKRSKAFSGPFVGILLSTLAHPAFRAMKPGAQMLYVHYRATLSRGGANNGKSYLSDRDAAEALGANKDTIARYYAELEHHGWLQKTGAGFLGADGRGIAARYRFTDLAYGTHPPTRDYEKWDGELFVHTRRRRRFPVRKIRTPCPQFTDIRQPDVTPSVCPQNTDTHSTPRCPQNTDISRIATPEGEPKLPRPGLDQGSSSRAPARAGGVGSSPTPEAKRVTRQVPKRGSEPHRAWAEARREELRAIRRRVRSAPEVRRG